MVMLVWLVMSYGYAIDRCALQLEDQIGLWTEHKKKLDTEGLVDVAQAAWMGRECLELDMKRTQTIMAETDRQQYDGLLRALYEAMRAYVGKTVTLLVATNQLDVAMVVARGFKEGLAFHFI